MATTAARSDEAFPLGAVAGLAPARRALLCVAVDPLLRGALVTGPAGCGKSLLLDAFAALLSGGADGPPLVRMPAGVGPDALAGALDWEATLRSGRRVARPGLLDRARGGLLLVSEPGLLDEACCGLLRSFLDGAPPGTLLLLSAREAAEVDPGLRDRVAFSLAVPAPGEEERRRVLRRVLEEEGDPAAFRASWAAAGQGLLEAVARARRARPAVVLPDAALRELHLQADALEVAGARGPLLAARAARAHAALRGAAEVGAPDTSFAADAVLAPRGRAARAAAAPRAVRERSGEAGSEGGRRPEGAPRRPRAEEVVDPRPAGPAGGLPRPTPDRRSAGPAGRRGSGGGRRGRRSSGRGRDRRSLALAETLRRAACRPDARRPGAVPVVQVRARDLVFRSVRGRSGTLFILAVDASGSMARNRMREAKGVALELLREAYVKRDLVALVAVRGREASLLLPPTAAPERARRELALLPTGGGTPLASAVGLATELAGRERRRSGRPALAVFVTDGRANVALRPGAAGADVEDELARLGPALRRAGAAALVLDTRPGWDPREHARRLAAHLGAEWRRLPDLSAAGVVRAVRDAAEEAT